MFLVVRELVQQKKKPLSLATSAVPSEMVHYITVNCPMNATIKIKGVEIGK